MKVFAFIFVLALVGLSTADETPVTNDPASSRGCYYIMGRCDRPCEEGTHAYALGCGYKTPEATCDEPNPVPETAMMCDWSSCYCDAPTVRDTASGNCVALADCPKKE